MPRRKAQVDYGIGYGKPPKHTRFKPGRSGNPKGRPRKSKNIATLMEKELSRLVIVKEGGETRRVPQRQAIVKRLINGALNGNTRQIEFLFKYLSQRNVPEPFEITVYRTRFTGHKFVMRRA